ARTGCRGRLVPALRRVRDDDRRDGAHRRRADVRLSSACSRLPRAGHRRHRAVHDRLNRSNSFCIVSSVDEYLLTEREGPVLVITLTRPHRRNAIDLPTADALAVALDELDGDPELRAAALTGSGSTFCAGMDLKAFAEPGERPISASRGGLGIVGRPPTTPVVGGVMGHVLG